MKLLQFILLIGLILVIFYFLNNIEFYSDVEPSPETMMTVDHAKKEGILTYLTPAYTPAYTPTNTPANTINTQVSYSYPMSTQLNIIPNSSIIGKLTPSGTPSGTPSSTPSYTPSRININISPTISIANTIDQGLADIDVNNKLKIMIKINIDFKSNINKYNISYPNYTNNKTDRFIDKLTEELSTLLIISKNKIKIIQLHPGSIYVAFQLYNSIDKSIFENNTLPIMELVTIFRSTINKLETSDYTIINKIDVPFGVKILNDIEIDLSFGSLIPKVNTIIDGLINSNTPFALYALIDNNSVPESSVRNAQQKMYLTTSMNGNAYTPCNFQNGMLKYTENLSLGSVYNIKEVSRIIPKPKLPYKYIDFDNILYDNMTKNSFINSTFYSVTTHNNNHSLSYCQQDCDSNNKDGLCAQEVTSERGSSQKLGTNPDGSQKIDTYNLKNLMKFKIETDGSITPYFISLDPIEKIYFLTNKYSTLDKPDDYKNIVQVPIYDGNNGYYEMPEYNEPPVPEQKYYTTKKVIIKDLLSQYSQLELDDYETSAVFPITQTLAFNNDAYKIYAQSFYIEILTPEQIKALPKAN